jgi:hypothetical protein
MEEDGRRRRWWHDWIKDAAIAVFIIFLFAVATGIGIDPKSLEMQQRKFSCVSDFKPCLGLR